MKSDPQETLTLSLSALFLIVVGLILISMSTVKPTLLSIATSFMLSFEAILIGILIARVTDE